MMVSDFVGERQAEQAHPARVLDEAYCAENPLVHRPIFMNRRRHGRILIPSLRPVEATFIDGEPQGQVWLGASVIRCRALTGGAFTDPPAFVDKQWICGQEMSVPARRARGYA